MGLSARILEQTALKDNTSPENNLPTVKFSSYFRTLEERERLDSRTEYVNGCCRTNAVVITPSTMVDIFNVARDIVQYPDKKQFYVAESCTTLANCTFCQCEVIRSVMTLVYNYTIDTIPQYTTGQFNFDRCCKCIRY
ncbi:hypothetical protein Ahia01_000804300 [Argonauta hians]